MGVRRSTARRATILPDDLKAATVISKPFTAAAVGQWLSQSLADR